MQESYDYLDIAQNIAKKMFIAGYTCGACLCIYSIKWSRFPALLRLVAKEMTTDRPDRLDTWRRRKPRRRFSNPHNLVEALGLKEIGQTYFVQTSSVFRSASYPIHSS